MLIESRKSAIRVTVKISVYVGIVLTVVQNPAGELVSSRNTFKCIVKLITTV